METGFEALTQYPAGEVFSIVVSVVALILAIDKVKQWVDEKKRFSYNEMTNQHSLEGMVETDHDKLSNVEAQLLAVTSCLKELVGSILMESHDKFMSRTPQPYITKYERLMHIKLYDAYIALSPDDKVVEGFHKEILELPISDA